MYFKLLSSLLSILLFTGCLNTPQKVAPKKESWYLSPPISTDKTLYALGEGKTSKESVSDALTTLLSTLNLTVSSEFHAQTVVKEGYNSSKKSIYTNDITTKLHTIEISNYKILKSKKLGYKHFVSLVSVDKEQLFRSLKVKVEQSLDFAQKQEADSKEKTLLQKIKEFKKIMISLKSLPNELKVMHSLNPNFVAKSYIERYNYFKIQLNNKLEQLSFYLVKKKNLSLVSSIETGLNQEGFNVVQKKDIYALTVTLTSNYIDSKAYGFFIRKSTLDIIVKDSSGKKVGINQHFITGQSTKSFKDANEDIAYKLSKLIKKNGVLQILGLNL